MKRHGFSRRLAAAVVVIAASCVINAQVQGPVRADNAGEFVVGEGSADIVPVMDDLINGDTSLDAEPDLMSYNAPDIDAGIADFDGLGPNPVDFAVVDRPLTSSEAAAVTAAGHSFAYVPFAAVPVALMALVPTQQYLENGAPTSVDFASDLCQHPPLTLTDLSDMFGYDSTSPMISWNDSRLTCNASSQQTPGDFPISVWANEDPTMENEAMMTYLDSDSAALGDTSSEATFEAGLERSTATTTKSTTPAETWPYSTNAIPQGDQSLLGTVVGLDANTNQPSTSTAQVRLGAILPITSVWTGDPLGPKWNLPTAAVQNLQGSFVAPSAASAQAAENDATLAQTSDPTTNNLVTFSTTNTTDAAAYNGYLMLESYFVVPTTGLSPDKAQTLGQFIRYALGSAGQKVIEGLGAAPATPAMVTAGLEVAQQLDAEAAAGTTTSTTTGSGSTTTTTSAGSSNPTTTTTAGGSAGGSTTTTTTAAGAGSGTSDGTTTDDAGGTASTSSSQDSSDGGNSGDLAFTGFSSLPILAAGIGLFVAGELGFVLVRRRRRHA